MKIILIGYGRMGKAVEKAATESGHAISARIDLNDSGPLTAGLLRQADVAIEFTAPQSAADNLLACIDAGLPVVSGTTGWYQRLEEVLAAVRLHNGSLLYASNFSVGVNLFFEMNRRMASLMASRPEFDVRIEEVHHVHKLDKPSGTAITLAEDIIELNTRFKGWIPANGQEADRDRLPVSSVREGEVTGIHAVRYASDTDAIEIRHEAFNRTGFATGAVLAAEWLVGKKGAFTMRDLLASLTQD